MRSNAWLPLILIASGGCATLPAKRGEDPAYLLERACSPGRDVTKVSGSVWLKAASKEASGQFPASVEAISPSTLRMEVTNLVGGTEATIVVDKEEFRIDLPGSDKNKARSQKGVGSWGGIPLRWAADLFLGKIPCPAEETRGSLKPKLIEGGGVAVEAPGTYGATGERFAFRFKTWAGDAWPESLVWERQGKQATRIEFKFEDPEDGTQSPKRWEAKSPQGEVKNRWKERTVIR